MFAVEELSTWAMGHIPMKSDGIRDGKCVSVCAGWRARYSTEMQIRATYKIQPVFSGKAYMK